MGEYAHARNVWETFKIEKIGEYQDLYRNKDGSLLADVFENLRGLCVRDYRLDPAHYFTISPCLGSLGVGLYHMVIFNFGAFVFLPWEGVTNIRPILGLPHPALQSPLRKVFKK